MNLSNKAGKIVMKPSFTDKHNAQDAKTRFDQIPGRIFLDTCALQYIQDFGEYIFDNYQEDEEYFLAPRGSGSGVWFLPFRPPYKSFDFTQDRFWAKSVRIFSNAHRQLEVIS